MFGAGSRLLGMLLKLGTGCMVKLLGAGSRLLGMLPKVGTGCRGLLLHLPLLCIPTDEPSLLLLECSFQIKKVKLLGMNSSYISTRYLCFSSKIDATVLSKELDNGVMACERCERREHKSSKDRSSNPSLLASFFLTLLDPPVLCSFRKRVWVVG